jgi:competence protein ComFC
MRCLLCNTWSLSHVCKACQKTFLTPVPSQTTLENGLVVHSFYPYDQIEKLLKTKHSSLGYYMFNILAKNSFKVFAKDFTLDDQVAVIPIDDHSRYGYAHTAILAKYLKNSTLKLMYQKLLAQNFVNYSGKKLAFRKANPRDFKVGTFEQEQVILVDDLITTGTTLSEAKDVLEKEGKVVLFALTLAKA